MRSLATCLKLHGIEKDSPEDKLIHKEVARYKAEGFAAHDAHLGVIGDFLKFAEEEHKSIVEQIRKVTGLVEKAKATEGEREVKTEEAGLGVKLPKTKEALEGEISDITSSSVLPPGKSKFINYPTIDQITKWIDPIRQALPGLPPVYVVDTWTAMPEGVQTFYEKKGETGNYKALYVRFKNGKNAIYIIADRHGGRNSVINSLWHEGGHHALRLLYKNGSPEFNGFLDDLYKSKFKAEIDTLGGPKGYGLDLDTVEGQRKAADEWWARTTAKEAFAQDPLYRRMWDRFVTIVRKMLNKIGIHTPMSRAEIRDMMRRGYEELKKEQGAPQPGEMEVSGLLAGEKAKGKPTGLSNAVEAAKQGASDAEIWEETGWIKGAEGLWRFEIDDSKANWKPLSEWYKRATIPEYTHEVKGKVGLQDVLNHPELFKHYPQLRFVSVEVDTNGSKVYYNEAENTIRLTEEALNNREKGKELLFHEIQHAIQKIEGFARGGSPEGQASRILDDEFSWLMKNNETFKDLQKTKDNISFEGTDPGGWKRKSISAQQDEILDEHIRNKYGVSDVSNAVMSQYRNLAGEVESRDTSARIHYNAEMRLKTTPYSSENIPRSQWIVRDGKGAVTSFSVEEKRAAMGAVAGKPEIATKYSILRKESLNDDEAGKKASPGWEDFLSPRRGRWNQLLEDYRQGMQRVVRPGVEGTLENEGGTLRGESWKIIRVVPGASRSSAFEHAYREFSDRGIELIPVKNAYFGAMLDSDKKIAFISSETGIWGNMAELSLHELFHHDVALEKREAFDLIESVRIGSDEYNHYVQRLLKENPLSLEEMNDNAKLSLGYDKYTDQLSEKELSDIFDHVASQIAEDMAADYVAGRLPDTIFKKPTEAKTTLAKWESTGKRYSGLLKPETVSATMEPMAEKPGKGDISTVEPGKPVGGEAEGTWSEEPVRLDQKNEAWWKWMGIPKPKNGTIKIYRGVSEKKGTIADEIKPGDWVTLSRKQAKDFYGQFPGARVLEKTVSLGDLVEASTNDPRSIELHYEPKQSLPNPSRLPESGGQIEDISGALAEEGTPLSPKLSRISEAMTKVKESTNQLWDAYKRPPEETESKKIIGKYTGGLQVIDLELSRLGHRINASIPKKRQEALTNYMQAGGDMDLLQERAKTSDTKYRKGYEDALNLSPEETQWADSIRQRLDDVWKKANDAGIDIDYIENYVRGEWERPDKAGKKILAMANAGIFRTKPKEALHKVFQDYYEGEQAGFVPKDKRIGYQLIAAERSIRLAIAARQALKALMKSTERDGRPTVAIGGAGSYLSKEEAEGKEAYFIKPNVKAKDTGDYKYIDHPALRKWKWVDKDDEGKPIFLEGNMWIHPDAYSRINALLGRSKVASYTVPEKIPIIGGTQPGRMALRAGAFVKGTILLGPFHQFHVAEHAVFHKVSPFALPEIDFEKRPVLKEGVEHGLMLFNHNALQEFGEGLAPGGLFHKIPIVGDCLARYQEWLFQGYIPKLKAAMFEHAVNRAEGYYAKQLESGKFTRDQLLENAAKQANAAFGEQNYKYIGRNPTIQDALRIGLLAPDFLEARLKFAGQALRPHGKEQAMALLRGAIIMGVTAQIINMLFGDEKKPHWTRPFSIIIGGREYTPRSVVGDMMHLITNPRSFWYYRLNPLWGRPLLEISTGKDFYGRKVGIEESARDVLKSWVPIPAQGIIKTNNGETFLHRIMNTVLQSVGMTNWEYRSDFEKYSQDLDKPVFKSTEKSRLKRELETELRKGRPDALQNIQEAKKEGKISNKEALIIKKEAKQTTSVRTAEKLTLDDLANGFEKATDEEKRLIYPIFRKKLSNKIARGELDKETIAKYRSLVKKPE